MMEVAIAQEILLERRINDIQQDKLWDKLSLAQKFAASSLTQFGYELTFIRSYDFGNVAVLSCGDTLATIAHDGVINSAPEIICRTT